MTVSQLKAELAASYPELAEDRIKVYRLLYGLCPRGLVTHNQPPIGVQTFQINDHGRIWLEEMRERERRDAANSHEDREE
ncbi:MAG TPA: hypothetical protein VNL71_02295 [Chloroflexota bacterium]|nr:hypothetical protein [Chloroflexota bacterium]